MKVIEVQELENIQGGTVSEVISGICAGITVATALRLIALSNVAAIGVAVVCVGNEAGSYFNWW